MLELLELSQPKIKLHLHAYINEAILIGSRRGMFRVFGNSVISLLKHGLWVFGRTATSN